MGDGRRKKTGYHPPALHPLSFFFFFPPALYPLYTPSFFFYGRPTLLPLPPCPFWFSFSASPPSPCCTPPRGALFSRCRPVHHPLPEKGGNCSVGTLSLPCADSAWECPHHCFPTTAATTCTHTHSHTHTGKETSGRNLKGERSCAVPRAGPLLLSTGWGETGGRVVRCFVLHWTKKLVYFVFHVQPCLVLCPPFPRSPTLPGHACFLPDGRRTCMADGFRSC